MIGKQGPGSLHWNVHINFGLSSFRIILRQTHYVSCCVNGDLCKVTCLCNSFGCDSWNLEEKADVQLFQSRLLGSGIYTTISVCLSGYIYYTFLCLIYVYFTYINKYVHNPKGQGVSSTSDKCLSRHDLLALYANMYHIILIPDLYG